MKEFKVKYEFGHNSVAKLNGVLIIKAPEDSTNEYVINKAQIKLINRHGKCKRHIIRSGEYEVVNE